MKFKLERHRIDKIPKEKILAELKRVAKLFDYRKFGWREFDKVSTLCKSACVKKNFNGSWEKALDAIGIPLKEKSKRKFSNREMFYEMERVWKLLGHRPSRTEWETIDTVISYNTYKKYYGGWTKACMKFIEFKMGTSIQNPTEKPIATSDSCQKINIKRTKKPRDVPLRLRLKVLKRDGFKCVFCGRSPAIDSCVILHVDHILPVAKGGATIYANLQTLCRECNLGKSDKF